VWVHGDLPESIEEFDDVWDLRGEIKVAGTLTPHYYPSDAWAR
jgi:hypothetical protein